MARAETVTILPLDRFARVLGLNPAHFNGVAGGSIMTASGPCADVWWQHSWQSHERVSREDIARAIAEAEEDLAGVLGYWPGPQWASGEVMPYPRHHRRDAFGDGKTTYGLDKSIRLRRGNFIQAGRRAVSVIQAGAAVVRSDADGDGFQELATITVATSLTDACEVHVYFAGHSGQRKWEIRLPKSKVISGGNAVITFDIWQLVNPTLQEALPTDAGARALVLTDSIYVTTVDVYREYTDFTQASAQFLWEPSQALIDVGEVCGTCGGTGCPACELTTQDGCLHVRDVHNGMAVPQMGTYDATTGSWSRDTWTVCREPDQVKAWYLSGDQDERFLAGETCEALPERWAVAITKLAVCKMDRPLCTCKSIAAALNNWRQDLSMVPDKGESFTVSDDALDNPFGPLRGQVEVWRSIFRNRGRSRRAAKVAVI